MEDLYEVLGCHKNTSVDEMKQAFQKLALIHHPDKLQQKGKTNELGQNQFHKIGKAWKILSNPDLRKQYDAEWAQRCLIQKWPVQEEVNIDEFEREEMEEVCYTFPCRCGNEYLLTEAQFLFGVDLVCCNSCSLCVKVIYSNPDSLGAGAT